MFFLEPPDFSSLFCTEYMPLRSLIVFSFPRVLHICVEIFVQNIYDGNINYKLSRTKETVTFVVQFDSAIKFLTFCCRKPKCHFKQRQYYFWKMCMFSVRIHKSRMDISFRKPFQRISSFKRSLKLIKIDEMHICIFYS